MDVGLAIVVRGVRDADVCSDDDRVVVLVTKRRADAVYAGWWELPGGKVEAGETIEACVERELLEETGVRARAVGPLPGVGQIVHAYPHATVRLHARLCALAPDSPPPANLLVADHKWVGARQLREHRFPEANEAVIESLAAWMSGQRDGGGEAPPEISLRALSAASASRPAR